MSTRFDWPTLQARRHLAAAASLVAAVVAVYANGLTGSFQLDDYSWLLLSGRVTNPGDLRAVLFGGTRPVAALVSAFNYWLSGESTLGWHLTNVAIHAVCCVLVWCLLRIAWQRLLPADDGPFAEAVCLGLALFFAVHPLNTMAVTYIVQGRMAALAGVFAVACLLCFDRFAQTRRAAWGAATLVCLGFGVATKEHVVTLPLVLLAWDVLVLSEGRLRQTLKTRGVFHAAAIGVPVVLGLAFLTRYYGDALAAYTGRILIRDAAGTVPYLTPKTYLFTQFGVVLRYLRLMVFPLGQSVEYYWPVATRFFSFPVLWPFAVLSALAAGAVALGRSNRLVLFGALWFALFLVVESSVLPLNDVLFEHRAYLPFVGVLLSLLGAVQLAVGEPRGRRLLSSHSAPRWVLLGFVVLAIPYGAATHARNEVWQTTVSLYEDALRKYPEHPRVRANLMSAYVRRGRYSEGLQLYEGLPEYYRNDDVVRCNVGIIYFQAGQLEVARRVFEPLTGSRNGDVRSLSEEHLRQIAQAQSPAGSLRRTVSARSGTP